MPTSSDLLQRHTVGPLSLNHQDHSAIASVLPIIRLAITSLASLGRLARLLLRSVLQWALGVALKSL